VAAEVRALGGTRTLVVAEPGVVAAGIVQPVLDRLAAAGIDLIKEPLPPPAVVPTTSGTGSEVAFCYVVTDTEACVKASIVSPYPAPKVALMDPLLTCTVRPHITASTGMDALCHAFESYTCSLANPITEGLARYSMELIGRYLKRAVDDGGDVEARTMLQLASFIGGMVDMPHGVACAIFLPHVFVCNKGVDLSKYARAGA